MNKNMIIDLINNISFTSSIKTKTESDGTIIQRVESRIQLPKPTEKPAPKPVLTEPTGFTMVFEKNPNMKIAAVKPHDNPNCVYITYKEYDDGGMLITGQFDRSGKLTSEYKTIIFDWLTTMRAFSPTFCAATNISVQHVPEMYVPRFLGAAMKAFKQYPDRFQKSIHIYNETMVAFNAVIENIGMGITNIQSALLKQLEKEKEQSKKYEEFLHQIQAVLSENDPEKYSGLIADIRGSLDVPVEERYIKAATHRRRRTRKEAVDAANDNK